MNAQQTLITQGLYVPHPLQRVNSGTYMNILEATEDMINIEDIAHSLSRQPRWGGHLSRPYSVAQHSIHCAELVDPEWKLQALLHDATEAYMVDLPSPIKSLFPLYKTLEDTLMGIIAKKFGVPYPFHPSVKAADKYMLEREWHEFMIKAPVIEELPVWTQDEAKRKFLETFYSLNHLCSKCNHFVHARCEHC